MTPLISKVAIVCTTARLCAAVVFNRLPVAMKRMKRSLNGVVLWMQWFAEYPEYLPNPFYVVGESYGGIYVPTLSRSVANGKLIPA